MKTSRWAAGSEHRWQTSRAGVANICQSDTKCLVRLHLEGHAPSWPLPGNGRDGARPSNQPIKSTLTEH